MRFKKTQSVLVFLSIFGFIAIGGVVSKLNQQNLVMKATYNIETMSASYVKQGITAQLSRPAHITKLYHGDNLIGVVSSEQALKAELDQHYKDQLAQDFPKSALGLADTVRFEIESSLNQYENVDQQIIEYLNTNNLITVETNKLSFDNGAIIYVQDLADFEAARQQFISSFVLEDLLTNLTRKTLIPDLTEYGTQFMGYDVMGEVVKSSGAVPIQSVYQSDAEILDFLKHGTQESEPLLLEPKPISDIGWMNDAIPKTSMSLRETDLVTINPLLRASVDLSEPRISAPLTVRVRQQRMVAETVYPEATRYIEDPNLRKGLTRVIQEGQNGVEDVLYLDVLENGINVESVVLSSNRRQEPVQEVIAVGTYVNPRVGTGTFRWPMRNAMISCGWGCYAGHRGIDIRARSNGGFGPIYASDNGVVEVNGFQAGGYGYYVVINHNNGFRTLYAHLAQPGFFRVGQTVAQGEQIGNVGMSGRTTGAHVHFEIQQNGIRRNPCNFMSC